MKSATMFLAVSLLILGACSQPDDGACFHYQTGEAITQVRDAGGRLWDVEKRSYRSYPVGIVLEGCSIPWEAEVETGGMPFMRQVVDETGRVIHSESGLTEWVYHSGSGERVETAPLLPDKVVRLVEYRWR